MTKDDLLTLMVYAIMMVAAIFIGIQVIGPALDDLGLLATSERVGFALITILIGAILNIFLFELGHVIGAKLGKYQIISVNFAGICIYRTEKRWKVRFQSFDGLTGETKVMPKTAKSNPKPYIWGPIMLFVIEFAVLIFGVYSFLPNDSFIKQGAMVVASVGAMLAIYDIMPFKLDTLNDGYRLVLISKPINVEAYNEIMRIQGLNYQGVEVKDIRVFEEITSLTASVNLLKVYDFEDQKNIIEANKLVDAIIANKDKINTSTLARATAQKIYIMINNKVAAEEIEKYWLSQTNEIRRLIGSDWALETIRVYLLYSGIVAKSATECAYAINRRPRAVKRLETNARLTKENVLFDEVLAQIKTANPDWEFEVH